MKTIIDYVNDLKDKFGNDYRCYKALKLGKSTLNMIRKRGQCSDETALLIADALGEKREILLSAASYARHEGKIKRAKEFLSKNATITMNSIVALGVMRPALDRVATTIVESVKCILCKIGHSAKNRFFTYTEKSNSERISHGFLFIAPGSWFNDW